MAFWRLRRRLAAKSLIDELADSALDYRTVPSQFQLTDEVFHQTNCLSVGGKIRDKLSLPPTVLQNKFSLFSNRKIEKYQCARGTAGKVSAVPFRVMAVLTQKLATPPLRLLESQSRYCTCGLVERQIRESHAWAALGSRTALHTTPQIS